MSKDNSRRYWMSPQELGETTDRSADSRSDVAAWMEQAPGTVNRRSFLKAAGFTFAAATAATGCKRAPVRKAIPYLNQPEGRVAGRAIHYASVCGGCEAGCGILVRNRDGRPIKLEGNPGNPVSRGGLCAIGQASILGLYDSHRYKSPKAGDTDSTWAEVDTALSASLAVLRSGGAPVYVVTSSVNSPTKQAGIDRFLASFNNGQHVVYDPISSSAILDAHEQTHGKRMFPRYRFDMAEVIASLDADFLGTWISPVEYTAGYQSLRQLDGDTPHQSYHAQFEARMSLTGTNADKRYRVGPDDLGPIVTLLAVAVAGKTHKAFSAGSVEHPAVPAEDIEALADRLVAAKGHGLVISGSQDVEIQKVCNFINDALGNYGSTVDLNNPSSQRQGNDARLASFAQTLVEGKAGAVFVAGVNPVYDLPDGQKLGEALAKLKVSVSFAERPDETSEACLYVCPDHHFLESWGDAEPVAGVASIRQPAIRPIFKTRSLLESLSAWMGAPQDARAIVMAHWESAVHPRSNSGVAFSKFWDETLRDGVAAVDVAPVEAAVYQEGSAGAVAAKGHAGGDAFTVVAYPKVGISDGRHAYNPWLQELPDPVTKVTWDNYASLSITAAAALKVSEGDMVKVEVGAATLELPAYVQPGQHDKVIAIALGYGQKTTERFSGVGPQWISSKPSVGKDGLVGKAVAPLLEANSGNRSLQRSGATAVRGSGKSPLACTQTYHTITTPENLPFSGGIRRNNVQETTLAAYKNDPAAGRPHGHFPEGELYQDDHAYKGHHWGMAVDLSACTGCSACTIACNAENNVPVVGKDEVRRRREMHWMRIDRYYSGPGDNVDVVHQPMMCQQCDNASCENVCPVLATVHTDEGLNAQVYNRCVGTRYCANNCAYKVRRFNWFNYRHDDQLENMVLNPDVTVRTRGIMEKCSFCIQRINEAKNEAKRKGVKLTDGDITPACQQTCPANAIVFGDMNDPESEISKLMNSPRHFRVLEEINVRPSVGYMTLVRNRTEDAQQEGTQEEPHHV